jgi:Ca2+-binding EF-hand superfamily protein
MANVIIQQETISSCRSAFAGHEDDGFLEFSSLKQALKEASSGSTDEELTFVFNTRGEENSKSGISFDNFVLMAMQLTELRQIRTVREDDARAAFVTLGEKNTVHMFTTCTRCHALKLTGCSSNVHKNRVHKLSQNITVYYCEN